MACITNTRDVGKKEDKSRAKANTLPNRVVSEGAPRCGAPCLRYTSAVP